MNSLRCASAFGLAITMAGCVGEKGIVDPLLPPERTLATVIASPQNAIVTVNGTVQIDVNGKSITGAPIAFDSVLYQLEAVSDTTKLTVSPSGLVTGHATTAAGPVRVTVIAYKDGVADGDEVIVQVTPTAISGAALSIQPPAGEPARLAMGEYVELIPVVSNPTTGEAVPNVQLRLTVREEDTKKLTGYTPYIKLPGENGVLVQPSSPNLGDYYNYVYVIAGEGKAWVFAEVDAYGTLLKDSVQYTLTYPLSANLEIQFRNLAVSLGYRSLREQHLMEGATYTFNNQIVIRNSEYKVIGGWPISFAFDNPGATTAATPPSTVGGASGDVPVLQPDERTKRKFLTPGTYRWTVTVGGTAAPFAGQTTSGTIVVHPAPQ